MDKYLEILKNDLSPQRFEHCLRVMETSNKLAIKYGVDVKKAKTAGLIHDCAKYDSLDKILQQVEEFGIILDKDTEDNKHLIHADLGAYIANKKYGIEDKEILDSIKYHTIGRKNMTKLDKIIYLADIIEPKRNFPGVDEIRERTFKDLDDGLIFALDKSIIYLIGLNKKIHPNTIEARNSLI